MKKILSNTIRLEKEIWGEYHITTFLNNYNPFKNLKPLKSYETSNRDKNYINYTYKLNENTYGYLQLQGKKYGEVFRLTAVKVEASSY